MKGSPKSLKGYKEISEDEEFKASLPPGTQISPGIDGGTVICIPHAEGFRPEIPDFRGPWAEIQKEIYRFQVHAACGGRIMPPRAKTPSKKINGLCDKWIKEFYADKNRWNKAVPEEIAPWLIARAMMVGMDVSQLDANYVSPPKEPVEEFMCEMLINFWREYGQGYWFGIHPDASAHSE